MNGWKSLTCHAEMAHSKRTFDFVADLDRNVIIQYYSHALKVSQSDLSRKPTPQYFECKSFSRLPKEMAGSQNMSHNISDKKRVVRFKISLSPAALRRWCYIWNVSEIQSESKMYPVRAPDAPDLLLLISACMCPWWGEKRKQAPRLLHSRATSLTHPSMSRLHTFMHCSLYMQRRLTPPRELAS